MSESNDCLRCHGERTVTNGICLQCTWNTHAERPASSMELIDARAAGLDGFERAEDVLDGMELDGESM